MGRKKIVIEYIKSDSVRRATFEKRRIGMIKKAMELSVLCGADISVTIKRKGHDDLDIYSSVPFDLVTKEYKEYRGEYTLLTNEHIDAILPGKTSSRDQGHIIDKQSDFGQASQYYGSKYAQLPPQTPQFLPPHYFMNMNMNTDQFMIPPRASPSLMKLYNNLCDIPPQLITFSPTFLSKTVDFNEPPKKKLKMIETGPENPVTAIAKEE